MLTGKVSFVGHLPPVSILVYEREVSPILAGVEITSVDSGRK
jgi:hypothetical protein